jgi:hypothetical protein
VTQLIPCPGCNRHVRQAESSCPFCSAELSLADVPEHVLPRTRLGRAATFAFGATLVGATTLVGCGGDSEEGKKGSGGAASGGTTSHAGNASGGSSNAGQSSGGTGITPVYGAPAAGTGNDDTGGSGGSSGKGGGSNVGGSAQPVYGGAPVYGAPAAGAGNTGGSPGVPIYGAAPAD